MSFYNCRIVNVDKNAGKISPHYLFWLTFLSFIGVTSKLNTTLILTLKGEQNHYNVSYCGISKTLRTQYIGESSTPTPIAMCIGCYVRTMNIGCLRKKKIIIKAKAEGKKRMGRK